MRRARIGVRQLARGSGVLRRAGVKAQQTQHASNTNYAWRRRFTDGNENNNNKNNSYRVRPCRR